jgi:outer membrane protein assembly factor BamB
VVPLPGGPEALVIDARRGRAYTHVGEGKTAAIDLTTHAVVETWSNGCEEAKGVALDAERGLLFIACDEGGIVALDVTNGKTVGRIKLAGGIDIIAYSPELGHVYVPSSGTARLAIVAVSGEGALKLLGTVPATKDSHCVAAAGKVFFGDPAHGRLRVVTDPYPASTH